MRFKSGGIQNTDIALFCVSFKIKAKNNSNDVETLKVYSICVIDLIVFAFEINIQECLLW